MSLMHNLRTAFLTICCPALLVAQTPGSLDPSFGNMGRVVLDLSSAGSEQAEAIIQQADGRLVVAGFLTESGGGRRVGLIQLAVNGDQVGSFGINGIAEPAQPFERFGDLVQTADGSLYLLGSGQLDGEDDEDLLLCRFAADGTFDTGFGVKSYDLGGEEQSGSMLETSDGQLLLSGASTANGDPDIALVKVDLSGDQNPAFGQGGILLTDYNSLSTTPNQLIEADNGDLLVGSNVNDPAGSNQFSYVIQRYTSTGQSLSNFGSGGAVLLNTHLGNRDFCLAMQPDGKWLVGGESFRGITGSQGQVELWRYLPDGQIDPTFEQTLVDLLSTDNEQAVDLALQSDGRILVGCQTAAGDDWWLIRYESNGHPDSSFGTDGVQVIDFSGQVDQLRRVFLQADGRLIGVGRTGQGDDTDWALARIRTGTPVSLRSVDTPSSWRVSPQPIRSPDWYLEGDAPIEKVVIQDLQGRTLIRWQEPVTHSGRIFMRWPAHIPAGTYLLTIVTKDRRNTLWIRRTAE